jgi:hypothetical protein
VRYPKRSERRAAWREANRTRGVEFFPETERTFADGLGKSIEGRRAPRLPWTPTPPFTPLQRHLLSTRGRAGHQTTLEVSLEFNRSQRRALHAKSGSRTLLAHGRGTSTPAQSFRFGPRWNRHALRIEAFRRLQARVAEHRRLNVWWRRLPRLLWILPKILKWQLKRAWFNLRAKWEGLR